MASPTQWTWFWANSKSWWWTRKPWPLQSMESQRVGLRNNWAIGLNWSIVFSSVQSLSHIRLIATPRITACQAALSITISWSSLKLMSIEFVYPTTLSSVIPFSSCLQSFPASGSFPMSQFFTSGGQSFGVHSFYQPCVPGIVLKAFYTWLHLLTTLLLCPFYGWA